MSFFTPSYETIIKTFTKMVRRLDELATKAQDEELAARERIRMEEAAYNEKLKVLNTRITTSQREFRRAVHTAKKIKEIIE